MSLFLQFSYLEGGSIREHLLSVPFLPVQVELTNELVACGPTVLRLTMPGVFVEKALVVLHKEVEQSRENLLQYHLHNPSSYLSIFPGVLSFAVFQPIHKSSLISGSIVPLLNAKTLLSLITFNSRQRVGSLHQTYDLRL